MKKKNKHPYLKLRKKLPPTEKTFVDRKKEADKKKCRERVRNGD